MAGWRVVVVGRVRGDGRSLRVIARAAGIDPGNLSRYVAGRAGLTLDAVERLCGVLGLRLTAPPTPVPMPQVAVGAPVPPPMPVTRPIQLISQSTEAVPTRQTPTPPRRELSAHELRKRNQLGMGG
jgi:AcrR family transcriptional regulator